MNLIQLFKAIANAIREKLGTSAPINAEDFPTQIGNISTGVDTSDANATASDIKTGKTAYAKGSKLTGTYTGIVPTGTKTITQNGTVDVTNYASAEVSVSATSENNLKIKSVITDKDIKKSIISFDVVDMTGITDMLDMFAYYSSLVTIPLLDTSNVTNMSEMFFLCSSLTEIPLLNTSNVTNMSYMFSNCGNLTTVPILNTSKVTDFGSMFTQCGKLSNETLDNILQMCANATSYTGTKTLKKLGLGFNSTYYLPATIQSLPHYQDFINAGWTIGY